MSYSFILDPEIFHITRASETTIDCFACIHYKNAYTLIHTKPVSPDIILESEGGWRMMSIEGQLDFSITGVLAEISHLLAALRIPIFVLSSYETDHILIKDEFIRQTKEGFSKKGWKIREGK